MKKYRIGAWVLIYGFLAVGAILCAVSAFLIAHNNAKLDYYAALNNETARRQTAGWMLCLVPAIVTLLTGVLYFLRKKSSVLWLAGIEIARIMMILPVIYMVLYRESLIFTLWGLILIFIATSVSYALWLFKKTDFVKNLFGWQDAALLKDEVFAQA